MTPEAFSGGLHSNSNTSIASFAPLVSAVPTKPQLIPADVDDIDEQLLNDAGAPMKLGADGQTLYCGCKPSAISERRCGPMDGQQCDDCWRAQVIARDRRNTALPRSSLPDLSELDDAAAPGLRRGRPVAPGGNNSAGAGSRSRSCTPAPAVTASQAGACNYGSSPPPVAQIVGFVTSPVGAAAGTSSPRPSHCTPAGKNATGTPVSPPRRPLTPPAAARKLRDNPRMDLAIGIIPSAAASYAPPGGDYTPLPPPPLSLAAHSHRPAPVTAACCQAATRCLSPPSPESACERGATDSPSDRGILLPVATAVVDEGRRRGSTDIGWQLAKQEQPSQLQQPRQLQHPRQQPPSQPCLTSLPRSLPPCVEKQFELLKESTGAARVLGSGAYAVVCLAREKTSGKARALKVVATQPLATRGLIDQARSEMSLQKSLRHPCIARALETVEANGHLYMVMELASLGNLREMAQAQNLGRLSPSQSALYVRQVVDAVAYLHSDAIRVIHRDIKAANVLLCSPTEAKLTDFGWSVKLSENALPRGMAGTHSHAAPEVVQGFPHGTGADLWSCGVLLYEVAVGALPFADNHSSFRANFQIPAFLPTTARDVVSKLLRLDPVWRARAEDLLQHDFFAGRIGAAERRNFTNIAQTETDSQSRAAAEAMALRTPPAGGRIQGSFSAVAPAAAVAVAGAAAAAQAPVTPTPANPLTPPARPTMSPAAPSLSATLASTMLAGASGSSAQQNHQRHQQPLEQTQPAASIVSLASPSPSFRTRIIAPATPGPTTRGIVATPANPVVSGTPTAPSGRVVQAGYSWAKQASPHRAASGEVRAVERPATGCAATVSSLGSGSLVLKVRGPAHQVHTALAAQDAFMPTSRTRSVTPLGRRPGDMTPQPGLSRPAVVAAASPNLNRPKQIPKVPPGHVGPQRLVSMPAAPLHYGAVTSVGTSITLATASLHRSTTHCAPSLLGHSTVSVATAKSAGA
eukprot:TRINITY_DN31256_c0_g2_i1.p1 TRINITY_DN31256_c0_g2~~TRINITY_DN31256_c0_g2_i1.p1  ORF type:complete len:1071 (+),score=155.65 TRINITY_DN31256_c0_g2_i1:286-3213(+)